MPDSAQREIFAITGLPPEVLAVAMAKYSRSPSSIKESIDELTEEKSADFHEKWVLGYGDASVADMAVMAYALENVSILASKVIEDNRLASYQEKSTRYQVFDGSRYYRPANVLGSEFGQQYIQTIEKLFTIYQQLVDGMIVAYRQRLPKPATSLGPDGQPKEMTEKMYEAKLKARSCDIARYVLPAATLTNLGMNMSARSLRHALQKMAEHPLAEVREIGDELRQAALSPAYNPQERKVMPWLSKLEQSNDPEAKQIAADLRQQLKLQVKGAPTLIKHTEAREYALQARERLQSLAQELLGDLNPAVDHRVQYITDPGTPEQELVATLLYSASNCGYQQILERVRTWDSSQLEKVISEVGARRGTHDWPLRQYEVGQGFVFDTLMDYGAFRDLQRHRICTQINQELEMSLGYEVPESLPEAGFSELFSEAMGVAEQAYQQVSHEFPAEAAYLIPMAYRKRTLFKMNLRELHHVCELRSKPGGHISYRRLVYDMYQQVKAIHPLLVSGMRVVEPEFERDFFLR